MILEGLKKAWHKGKEIWKKLWAPVPRYLLLCMAIPALLMYFIYLAKGIHPFGDSCVLVLDLNGQYVWFFEALRNFVRGDASLLYSFSRSLGGEFLGMYAYYLASPLSYLLALFPRDRMLEGLLFLFLLKTAVCGGTFGYYMHKTLKKPKPEATIIFSVLYALSAYAVVQQHNTMWIDALMWLPLITLGIEELIKYGRFKRYTIFLALTLISNFYIGYMVCIYCPLYFFAYYIGHGGYDRENNPLCENRHFPKTLLRMAFYSVIAVGIAAIILLGAYYSLNFGKTTFSNPKWEWDVKMELKDLFYKFLPGSYDTVRPAGLPFVYCGVLTLLLVPAYFFSRKYPVRQRIISAVFILIFLVSFLLTVPDLLWHGF
ncbi:MAG: YfhO family protein, partial [Clostridia bacterium]|nr:YfhO family protein [Clostridia bacterium]